MYSILLFGQKGWSSIDFCSFGIRGILIFLFLILDLIQWLILRNEVSIVLKVCPTEPPMGSKIYTVNFLRVLSQNKYNYLYIVYRYTQYPASTHYRQTNCKIVDLKLLDLHFVRSTIQAVIKMFIGTSWQPPVKITRVAK